ncbi:hypothetical protein B0A55_07863 [Friedmanniomyces simplex]|uniref:DnaJ homologue subfamily C member 28 conserved domain-containing protein n=1 Tax=Friedmanniomyces simplex TaxID=329884 RepID=A0A4U0X6Q1_9PEZI|nr:hypothetical protein B0A55_07863 [Friedmanniomyces simplex]
MQGVRRSIPYTCARLRTPGHDLRPTQHVRLASNAASPPEKRSNDHGSGGGAERERGALSRRLEQMSEESLETGGKSAVKAVEEAGFGEDLKRQLEEKIASATFRNENANAFAQASVPSSAGKGTRDIAAAQAWTGTESIGDASLRMLNDAHKPLRLPPRVPGVRQPTRVDTGRSSSKPGTGVRLATARDKTSAYATSKDPSLSEQERKKLRAELKARFQAGARQVPATVQGLASLANERIEDAIARGQFKNLPRGKEIVRDYNASNPFLDTTEYFMNKMIQKQEIVPPWIEKQQELVSTATRFRSRLRVDWRRHVSRSIASKGGPLERQTRLADEYAFAESWTNPLTKKVEQVNAVDDGGHISQITLSGELKPTPAASERPDAEIEILEQTFDDNGNLKAPEAVIKVTAEQLEVSASPEKPRQPTVPPFRDPQWEQTETSYLRTAIDSLNSLTRSYNLMAPDLAKKPYFSLDRELRTCFADVAPTVSAAIRERALAPKIRGVEVIGHKPGGVLDKFAMDRAAHVHDERKPQYGFKQFWRDLFAPNKR